MAQWGAGIPADKQADPNAITVIEILAGYLHHAAKYYGEGTQRYDDMRRVALAVSEVYDALPASEFSPKKLQTVRQFFVQRGNRRRQCNDYTRDVIAIFAWAVEQELIPGSVVHALREV